MAFWLETIFFGSDQTWSNFLARNDFLAVMAFLQKLLFVQKYFCQIWSGFLARKSFFSNESALLLKVLKGLARLWWLKAFRLVLQWKSPTFCRRGHLFFTICVRPPCISYTSYTTTSLLVSGLLFKASHYMLRLRVQPLLRLCWEEKNLVFLSGPMKP